MINHRDNVGSVVTTTPLPKQIAALATPSFQTSIQSACRIRLSCAISHVAAAFHMLPSLQHFRFSDSRDVHSLQRMVISSNCAEKDAEYRQALFHDEPTRVKSWSRVSHQNFPELLVVHNEQRKFWKTLNSYTKLRDVLPYDLRYKFLCQMMSRLDFLLSPTRKHSRSSELGRTTPVHASSSLPPILPDSRSMDT